MNDDSVLIVESTAGMRNYLRGFLTLRGYSYVIAYSAEEALSSLIHRSFRFTVLETETGGDAAAVIQKLKAQRGSPGPIIAIAERGKDTEGPAPGPAGADALVYRPVGRDALDQAIADVLSPGIAAPAERADICEEIDLWCSPGMQRVRQILSEAAGVDVTVLITGETGTGKDVVARAIQHLSARRHGPFVKVNCAAVPRELLESELFGHERGAFTGAHRLKTGKFESANHGTIFLDEIGDLHSSLQAKLLHVLQDGDFTRVGGKSLLRVDVRVLAATNQDLERAVLEGRFREDLYYRLNVIQISVPPLRERVQEIPGLIQYFVKKYAKRFRREGLAIPAPVMDALLHHRYRGNVRELENLVKRIIVLGDPHVLPAGIAPAAPELDVAAPASAPVALRDIVRGASRAAERDAIRKVLDEAGWNRVRAAKTLRISYRALLYKMKRLGLRDVVAARPAAGWTDPSPRSFMV